MEQAQMQAEMGQHLKCSVFQAHLSSVALPRLSLSVHGVHACCMQKLEGGDYNPFPFY